MHVTCEACRRLWAVFSEVRRLHRARVAWLRVMAGSDVDVIVGAFLMGVCDWLSNAVARRRSGPRQDQ